MLLSWFVSWSSHLMKGALVVPQLRHRIQCLCYYRRLPVGLWYGSLGSGKDCAFCEEPLLCRIWYCCEKSINSPQLCGLHLFNTAGHEPLDCMGGFGAKNILTIYSEITFSHHCPRSGIRKSWASPRSVLEPEQSTPALSHTERWLINSFITFFLVCWLGILDELSEMFQLRDACIGISELEESFSVLLARILIAWAPYCLSTLLSALCISYHGIVSPTLRNSKDKTLSTAKKMLQFRL